MMLNLVLDIKHLSTTYITHLMYFLIANLYDQLMRGDISKYSESSKMSTYCH